jgi:hypothetical protein
MKKNKLYSESLDRLILMRTSILYYLHLKETKPQYTFDIKYEYKSSFDFKVIYTNVISDVLNSKWEVDKNGKDYKPVTDFEYDILTTMLRSYVDITVKPFDSDIVTTKIIVHNEDYNDIFRTIKFNIKFNRMPWWASKMLVQSPSDHESFKSFYSYELNYENIVKKTQQEINQLIDAKLNETLILLFRDAMNIQQ